VLELDVLELDVLELDVLEFDELWSFVFRRKDKRWIWLAKCRRTRQVVAYCTGRPGRRHRGPQRGHLPPLVGACPARLQDGPALHGLLGGLYEVLPQGLHRATGKGAGQTCHIERFNNVLRQRLGRLVRRTLSFSKIDAMHENCLRIFLYEYNQPNKRKVERIRLA